MFSEIMLMYVSILWSFYAGSLYTTFNNLLIFIVNMKNFKFSLNNGNWVWMSFTIIFKISEVRNLSYCLISWKLIKNNKYKKDCIFIAICQTKLRKKNNFVFCLDATAPHSPFLHPWKFLFYFSSWFSLFIAFCFLTIRHEILI